MFLPTAARRGILLFFSYVVLWALANLPAVRQAWWAVDDYAYVVFFHWRHNYENGRPLANLFFSTLPWEMGAYGEAINIGMRAFQGAVHAGVALIVALLLYQRTRTRAALVAATIFLVWPHNGEAVLWRAAGTIPLSALLSVAGALLASMGGTRRRLLPAVLGMLLVAAAVLIQQLGAMAGLVLWAMVLALQARPPARRDIGAALWIGAGYVVGALISKRTARFWLGDAPGRDQLATDFWAKLDYGYELWQDFLWPFTSPAHGYFQMALVVLLAVALVAHLLFAAEPWHAKLLRVAATVSLFLLPIAPLLVFDSSPTSARVLYLAPLLLVTACIASAPWLERLLHTPDAAVLLAGALVVVYLPLATRNAADFPRIYTADQRTLAELSATLRELEPQERVNLVIADMGQYLRSHDPHNAIDFPNGDAKLSGFMLPWASSAFVEWRSDHSTSADPLDWQMCTAACLRTAEAAGEKKPFTLLPLEESRAYCLCP